MPVEYAASMTSESEFLLLNEAGSCDTRSAWNSPEKEKLWLYNLHYFDDLNARTAKDRRGWHRRLLTRWINENPPGVGAGWEPYVLSKRIVNWCKWLRRNDGDCNHIDTSLAIQVRWLAKSIEYHLLGNHLLMNAKALMIAGMMYEGPEADSWYQTGKRIISRQIPEQVLNDGGHFELSPMYHAAMMEDLLDLLSFHRASNVNCPSIYMESFLAMRGWLANMCHPDGEIPFFNDAAFGIAPRLVELDAYAARLGVKGDSQSGGSTQHMIESGYVTMRNPEVFLACDCAPVGPHYLPAHAHADTLSFELSLFGQRVFVNSGTSVYGTSEERHRQRSTSAHNTVCVDDENSSEIWSGFRVARRARSAVHEIELNGHLRVAASHDGYKRLPGKVRHFRCWEIGDDNLQIEDRLEGRYGDAMARFHLHPDIVVKMIDGTSAQLELPDGKKIGFSASGARSFSVEASTWHPEFGKSIQNSVLVVGFLSTDLVTRVTWRQAS